jgi:hypothetical protein
MCVAILRAALRNDVALSVLSQSNQTLIAKLARITQRIAFLKHVAQWVAMRVVALA